ncbi:hypothetical protein [Streptomyces sp. NPDC018347]|uniref:hypothetical protein n=1 Tax=Streptomyces sp. NPDC018347 TaxID=3157193 RepID=UPI0033D79B2A
MSPRLLPLLLAALVSVAGCTTVTPGSPPDAAGTALPADATVRAPAPRSPAHEPSPRTALVRTGHGHPDRPGPTASRGAASGAGPGRAAPPRSTGPAAPPSRHPERRSPAGRPAHRARPASRPSGADRMSDLCRQADRMAAPKLARLCHDTYG